MKNFKLKINGKWIMQKAYTALHAMCEACKGMNHAVVLVMCCFGLNGQVEFVGRRWVL